MHDHTCWTRDIIKILDILFEQIKKILVHLWLSMHLEKCMYR